jgi:hypothetical protein
VTAHPVRDNRQNRVVFLAFPPVSCLPGDIPSAPRDLVRAPSPLRRRPEARLDRHLGRLPRVSRQQRRPDKAGGLTVLTEEEPIAELALEVLERGIADEVAVLAVLEGAVGPAGAIEGVVLHGNDVHDRGNEAPVWNSLWYLYPPVRRNNCKHKNKRSQVTWW